MKVIRKQPGQVPEVVEVENEMDAFRAEVGGIMKRIRIAQDLAIIYDKDGRIKRKERNNILLAGDCFGTVLIVGMNEGDFCDVPKLDWVLWTLFRVVRYGRADRAHNVWNCRHCGHMQQFEADGPFENGWNLCPVCGGFVLRPVSNAKA